jgi:hypothetical protein
LEILLINLINYKYVYDARQTAAGISAYHGRLGSKLQTHTAARLAATRRLKLCPRRTTSHFPLNQRFFTAAQRVWSTRQNSKFGVPGLFASPVVLRHKIEPFPVTRLYAACARVAGLKRGRDEVILDEVVGIVRHWQHYANEAAVSAKQREQIGRTSRLQFKTRQRKKIK